MPRQSKSEVFNIFGETPSDVIARLQRERSELVAALKAFVTAMEECAAFKRGDIYFADVMKVAKSVLAKDGI